MEKKKKRFIMPHLFWIMMGLLVVVSCLTYIIPAGQFGHDPQTGALLADEFTYLGEQHPVSIWRMFMLMLKGLMDSGLVIWVVLTSGAMTAVIMVTGAFDEFLNWAIYKLKDKSENILICIMFILMTYLGGFGGTDALIAVVPIGVMFTKKLKLDPICAIGMSTYATLLGFGTGPVKQATTQMLMEVDIYGAFFTMFISMNFFMVIGLLFLLSYIKKIKKDPTKSLMYSEGWRPDTTQTSTNLDEPKEVNLSWRTIAILSVYFGQYLVLVLYPFIAGSSAQLFDLMIATSVLTAIIGGFIGKLSFNQIGEEFSKGLGGLAFIGFVIGLAKVISLVLTEGMILDTIVYALTRPLMDLSQSVASIGVTAVVSVLNLLVPSAISKAAMLTPILKPVGEALSLSPELTVQAFQYGDGFTNMFSPFLGWTVGSCVIAGVPFFKWFRWVFPKVLCFITISFIVMFFLTEIGWTAF